jgi:hypothetical protein
LGPETPAALAFVGCLIIAVYSILAVIGNMKFCENND